MPLLPVEAETPLEEVDIYCAIDVDGEQRPHDPYRVLAGLTRFLESRSLDGVYCVLEHACDSLAMLVCEADSDVPEEEVRDAFWSITEYLATEWNYIVAVAPPSSFRRGRPVIGTERDLLAHFDSEES